MTTAPKVVLVSMPWASAVRPSLAVGLLTAEARARGIECEGKYLNLGFSAELGSEPYEALAIERSLEAVGEHLFAVDLFGARALASDRFLERPLLTRRDGITAEMALHTDMLFAIRDVIVPAFLEEATEELLATGATVIGFSCVFNQVMPSLALARRLREANPRLTILLGGGSVHGAMGEAYARVFRRDIDHVFTGEADLVFPEFLSALTAGAPIRLPGVTVDGKLERPAVPVAVLDALPTPDYGAYFATRAAVESQGGRLTPNRDLPYESARGCWWGEKSHCTFCGLNTEGMASRNKSTDRVVTELTDLSRRYRTTVLTAADNILSYTGYRDLLPRLADLKLDLRLFYEIKANVSRDDVAALFGAGVLWLQPGIESFSDHVLALMRKGVTAAQNIQLLKWLQEYGITPYYNLLVGFPGETDDDFEAMLRLLPSLFHLTPPVGNGSQMVQVHRFSPFFNEPEQLGITGVRPEGYYRHLIPPRLADPAGYAYFFQRDIPRNAPFRKYRDRLDELLGRWSRSRTRLTATLGAGFVSVRRGGRRDREIATLEGADALVFLLADSHTSDGKLSRQVAEALPGRTVDVAAIVARLVAAGILVRAGERLVGVVPFERPRSTADLSAWARTWLGAEPRRTDSRTYAAATSPAAR